MSNGVETGQNVKLSVDVFVTTDLVSFTAHPCFTITKVPLNIEVVVISIGAAIRF